MRRWLWVTVGLACAVVVWLGVALGWSGQGSPYDLGHGELVSGEWYRQFRSLGTLTPEGQLVTDYAFGPGRMEVAFLGPKAEASALWITSGQALLDERQRIDELRTSIWRERRMTPEEDQFYSRPWVQSPAAPRLLWKAPAGVTLRGPIRWTPNGDALLVRACQGKARDLVAVDYVTGEATWLTRDAQVDDASWAPSGKLLAYVTREEDRRAVWLRSFPTGEPQKLGEGGYDLRWSADSATLQWLAPNPGTVWTEMELDTTTNTVAKGGERPARPEETIWSPDGKWCAALLSKGEGKEKQIVIWRASAATGDEVPLPGLNPQRLLGWSPDSLLLLVLGSGDYIYMVSASPPRSGAIVTAGDGVNDSIRLVYLAQQRARATWRLPFDLPAGDPAWSSDGKYLIYAHGASGEGRPDRDLPLARLVMLQVDRQHVTVYEKMTPKIERAIALFNVKNVALALNMYLADWDAFPLSNDQHELVAVFEDYVRNNDVFMRPGTKDEVVVRWVFDPTKRLQDIGDAGREEAMIVDYHPDFYVVGYLDGHARAFDKKKQ